MAAEALTGLILAARRPGGALPVARAAFERAGLTARAVPGTPAVVLTRGDPRLCFCGHVDVVPEGEGWAHPPGRTAEGRIFGRGAADMLGSVAAWIEMARDTSLPLAVALTTDEETRMGDAEALVASGLLDRFSALVVGEPTDLEVGIAEKGVLWLRAEVTGRAAHASMPTEGINAIEAAARAVLRLRDLQLPGKSETLGPPTLSVDRIAGGSAVNVVPESCALEVDVRYLPGTPVQAVVDLIDATLARAVDVHRLTVLSHHPPYEAAPGSELVVAAERAVGVAGRQPRRVGLPYGTEASRYLRLEKEMVLLGPGERLLAHTNRESIRLDDLAAGRRAYAALAEAYA